MGARSCTEIIKPIPQFYFPSDDSESYEDLDWLENPLSVARHVVKWDLVNHSAEIKPLAESEIGSHFCRNPEGSIVSRPCPNQYEEFKWLVEEPEEEAYGEFKSSVVETEEEAVKSEIKVDTTLFAEDTSLQGPYGTRPAPTIPAPLPVLTISSQHPVRTRRFQTSSQIWRDSELTRRALEGDVTDDESLEGHTGTSPAPPIFARCPERTFQPSCQLFENVGSALEVDVKESTDRIMYSAFRELPAINSNDMVSRDEALARRIQGELWMPERVPQRLREPQRLPVLRNSVSWLERQRYLSFRENNGLSDNWSTEGVDGTLQDSNVLRGPRRTGRLDLEQSPRPVGLRRLERRLDLMARNFTRNLPSPVHSSPRPISFRSPADLDDLVLNDIVGSDSRGVKQSIIDELPTRKFVERSKPEDEKTDDVDSNVSKGYNMCSCVICMEVFETSEDVKTLPCLHIYHPKCIDKWLSRNCTCPICKRDVTKTKRDLIVLSIDE